MQSLFEYITESNYNKLITEELVTMDSEELYITEAFKSTLLKNLAKKIKQSEEKHKEYDKAEEAKARTASYYYKPRKLEKSFTSIFGAIDTVKNGKNTKIYGLDWANINDSDFTFVKNGSNSKDYKKALKNIFSKDGNGEAIICAPDTKDPVYFIKGYGKYEVDGHAAMYFFQMDKTAHRTGVVPLLAPKNKNYVRNIKLEEILDSLEDYDVYVLDITQDMIKKFDDIHIDRENAKKGTINFDKESLDKILKNQQARYRALASEMRAKKLQENPLALFDEIKEINDKVIDLYKRVFDNPENLDLNIDIATLMDFVSRAYDKFYQSLKYKKSSEKYKLKRKEELKKSGKDFNEEDFNTFDFYGATSKDYINSVKDILNDINKRIKDIESKLK